MNLKRSVVISLTAAAIAFSGSAQAAGKGTHTALNYALVDLQAHLPNFNTQCGFVNGRVVIYDRDIKVGNNPSKLHKWAYVVLKVDPCVGDIVTYAGSIVMTDSDFYVSIPTPMQTNWSAMVNKSLTVRNTKNSQDTITVNLSLSWASIDVLHHYASNTKVAGTMTRSAQTFWRPAKLTGQMTAISPVHGNLQFDLATQMRGRIVDTQSTVHQ